MKRQSDTLKWHVGGANGYILVAFIDRVQRVVGLNDFIQCPVILAAALEAALAGITLLWMIAVTRMTSSEACASQHGFVLPGRIAVGEQGRIRLTGKSFDPDEIEEALDRGVLPSQDFPAQGSEGAVVDADQRLSLTVMFQNRDSFSMFLHQRE